MLVPDLDWHTDLGPVTDGLYLIDRAPTPNGKGSPRGPLEGAGGLVGYTYAPIVTMEGRSCR